MKDTTTLAERLRTVREERGLKASALSLAAGLSQAHVGMIERGLIACPSGDALNKLAKELRVNLEWLVAGTGSRDVKARKAS